jgi:hypothetical protein
MSSIRVRLEAKKLSITSRTVFMPAYSSRLSGQPFVAAIVV